jgi:hypothetical protein
MYNFFGKMRKAVGFTRSNKSNRSNNVTFKNNRAPLINNRTPLKLVLGERVNMNDIPNKNNTLKKSIPNQIPAKNPNVKSFNKKSFTPIPNAINYENLLSMNKEKLHNNEMEQLDLQIVHQNHPNAARNMELYSQTNKILSDQKDLINDMKTMGKYNLYKSVILTSTIVATTASLDIVLGSTIILAPLIPIFSGFMYKVNDYIQSKYLWKTGANSFNEYDIETLINILNMYIRLLSSPIVKPLFKERSLFEGNFRDYMILKSIVDGKINENDPSVTIETRNIYSAIKKFKSRHDKKISVWNVLKIIDYSKKISYIIEEITNLNLIHDKIKFTGLFNLFISYYNILEMTINIHHTNLDNIEWMIEIEKLEKKITRDKVEIISNIEYSIKQNKKNPWFRNKKETSYDISSHDIMKLAELT